MTIPFTVSPATDSEGATYNMEPVSLYQSEDTAIVGDAVCGSLYLRMLPSHHSDEPEQEAYYFSFIVHSDEDEESIANDTITVERLGNPIVDQLDDSTGNQEDLYYGDTITVRIYNTNQSIKISVVRVDDNDNEIVSTRILTLNNVSLTERPSDSIEI